MVNNTNFYLSGLIAFALFSLFFLLFILFLFSPQKSKTFALKKDNFISISLVTSDVKIQKVKKQKTVEEVAEVEKIIDVNNLFSDVWTKKIVHKKEKVIPKNSKRLLEIQKRIKTSTINDVKPISKKDNKSVKQNSTADEVNEYLAKIQAIVYSHFRVPANSEGSSVKTVIELNALGRVMDFRVLNYSNNQALNSEADKIRERLIYVTFPKNPEKKSSRTVVILISKE